MRERCGAWLWLRQCSLCVFRLPGRVGSSGRLRLGLRSGRHRDRTGHSIGSNSRRDNIGRLRHSRGRIGSSHKGGIARLLRVSMGLGREHLTGRRQAVGSSRRVGTGRGRGRLIRDPLIRDPVIQDPVIREVGMRVDRMRDRLIRDRLAQARRIRAQLIRVRIIRDRRILDRLIRVA